MSESTPTPPPAGGYHYQKSGAGRSANPLLPPSPYADVRGESPLDRSQYADYASPSMVPSSDWNGPAAAGHGQQEESWATAPEHAQGGWEEEGKAGYAI